MNQFGNLNQQDHGKDKIQVDSKMVTPKKLTHCNCKHSRCVKMYCECFGSGIDCNGCNCVNCFNNAENEAARREAMEKILKLNPNAFTRKLAHSLSKMHF